MACEEEHSLAALRGAVEVLEAVVDDGVTDVFGGVAGEEADFAELAAEGSKDLAHDLATIARAHLGEGKLQIAHADAAQLSVQQVDKLCEADACGTGEGAGERSDRLHQAPGERVLESEAHQGEAVTVSLE